MILGFQRYCSLVRDMILVFREYHFRTEIIVASVRHPLHVVETTKSGADVAHYRIL